ncbi:cytoskeleton-associated protein 5 [Asbolus verrucosus]|uniref:Cytoskeleton-associated protein 5 n=1 Tax=Asbolus verrucosus TaxID=1661398 RepID=A0A482VIW0_ASBVE|nr:cytoskeleton-associated protein 5 [Asbolus verrucosus]
MEDEEYKKLPVEDRCVHKLWKARVNGYEEVTKLFRQIDDEKSPEFGKYLGLVKKFVIDSNAMGQEKGLEATLAYVENYAHAGKTVSEVMSGVVAKCIAAPKTRTRELAVQITLMYIEIEKCEAVQEELLKGMDQKNPKIVAACISACTVALREFGSRIFNVKSLVKKIPTLFADRDKGVRDEARQMVIEMYRWIGGALRSQLNNLQPVQVTELEAEFSKVDGQKAVPIRFIRSEQQKQSAPVIESEEVDAGRSDEEDDYEAPQMDPYDLADPVDILSKLPKDFNEKIEAKKWQERKEALEALEKLVKTPKLQNGDYSDIVRTLKKVIEKDSNVVVVALAGRCLAGIASGLKKRFQVYSGACIPSLLEKFKERKQNVVTAMKEAIDAIYLTTNMEAILEDVAEALGNKNPSVKTETSCFLARCFTKTPPTVFNKKMLKLLTTCLLKNINEPDPSVRDSSAEALGTLMKLVGEKAIGPFLVELEKDNIKMAKIKECCDKAVITIKVAGGKKDRPTTAPAKTSTKSLKGTATPRSAPTPNKSANNVPKKKTEAINSGTVVRSKGKNATKTVKITEKELSDVEVDEMLSNIVSASVLEEISDSNWKVRLAAAEQFFKDIQVLDAKDVPTQAIIRALAKRPGLKDTNFQVLKAKIDIIKYLAENATFSTTSGNCCLNEIMEKFGDTKNGTLVGETMTAIAEVTNLAYVSNALMEFLMNQKNPKVIQEALLWQSNAIKDFGFSNLNAKLFIEGAKKALASTNPGVRQTAVTFCGVLYLYMGSSIYVFFENEKPALRDQINVEIEKYKGMKPPPPTRGVVKCASANSLDDLDDEEVADEAEANVQNVSDLLPRVDISGQITESLISEIDDKNWKVRNEALSKVNAIIQEAKFIKPNIGDLPQALAHRLTDSNSKIAQTAINICDAIAKAMGLPCKQFIKVFFPCLLQNLGDNKPWIRTAARDAIDTFSDNCGYREFFENEMITDALKSGSPMLRIELWGWLAEKLPKIPVKSIPREEITICIPHLYSNLEDRNSDVRKNAQEAILGIMIHVGYETMVKNTEKLKPSSKQGIMISLEKVRPNLPVKPLPKKPTVEKEDKVVKGTKAVANSKNAVKPKGSGTLTKSSSTTNRKKEEDIDTSPLLVINNMKHQRTIDESKLKVLKWNFTTPREEFVELLRDQMTAANVNKSLMFNMFHMDFRFHIKAIESLIDDLPDHGPALVANLDLILKWLTLRFFDTNPSVLLKGLEYLHMIFNMLIETKYRMLENEASSFLPYLVVKIGDPKDTVRNGVRSLFKQICHVYSVSRLFTYIMEGVKSKNARQRAECLEAMGSIIQDYGIVVCIPSPASCLKEVAKQISDRDNSVRNAALNCVVQAYNIVGEKVYKMVGNISDKDLSLLEERIKRSTKKNLSKPLKVDPGVVVSQFQQKEHDSFNADENGGMSAETERNEDEEEDNLPPVIMMPPRMIQEINEPTGPFRLDPQLLNELDKVEIMVPKSKVQEFDLEFLNSDVNIPTLSAADIRAKIMPLSPPKPLDPNLSMSRLSLSGQKQQSPKKQDPVLISSINQVASPDANTAFQGIAQVLEFLQSPRGCSMIDYENDFIRAIVTQLKHLRGQDPTLDHNVARVYRSILTVIDAFYRTKNLGQQVSVELLKDIIDQLIHILVDGKLENCTNGDAYVRVINLHCVKIIEKSNHTKILCALVQLMHECTRMDNLARHTDLVMKCLWRVIKLMPSWSDDVDYDSVLLEVHNFLKEFPSTWWKNKPMDTTLRTIKTILHSSVRIKGGSIMLHFGKIPNTSESEIESYILKLLKSMNLDAVKQTQRVPFSRATHTMLTEIFQKIGSKDDTKEGLTLLYDFMQQHPEADIEPFLKKSSKLFQDYIQNGLREIEESRKSTKSTIEKVEEKVAQTITSSSQGEPEDQRGPEYWEQRLTKWQKVWDNTKDRGENE